MADTASTAARELDRRLGKCKRQLAPGYVVLQAVLPGLSEDMRYVHGNLNADAYDALRKAICRFKRSTETPDDKRSKLIRSFVTKVMKLTSPTALLVAEHIAAQTPTISASVIQRWISLLERATQGADVPAPNSQVLSKPCLRLQRASEKVAYPPFRQYIDNLLHVCAVYSRQEPVMNVMKQFVAAIARPRIVKFSQRFNIFQRKTLLPDRQFESLFELRRTQADVLYKVRMYRFKGQKGLDLGGLTRVMLQSCISTIIELEFFELVTGDGEDERYGVNKNPTKLRAHVAAILERNDGRKPNETAISREVLAHYQFVGELFVHLILSRVPLPLPFSRTTLFCLLYDPSSLTCMQQTLFYLLDCPTTKILVGLSKPDEIEYYGFEFPEEAPIYKNAAVTKETYIEFICATAHVHMLHPTAIDALYELRKGFNHVTIDNAGFGRTMNIDQLFSVLCDKEVVSDDVRELSDKMHSGMVSNKLIVEWMREILVDIANNMDGASESRIPLDSSGLTEEHQNELRSNRIGFFRYIFGLLMEFWSGKQALIKEEAGKFSVNIVPSSTLPITTLNSEQVCLPTTHTCSYALNLPSDITSMEQLYRVLLIAILNLEQGVGLL